MGKLILVSGAVRSGKSAFAERFALQIAKDKPIAYLATAQALDQEMSERIKIHRRNRSEDVWQTFEEPYLLKDVLLKHYLTYHTWLLDCITLYISNLLLAQVKPVKNSDQLVDTQIQKQITGQINELIDTITQIPVTFIAVTNEVGWGLVPPDPLGRVYRDILGRVNQKFAEAAEEVYLLTMGIPLRLKPSQDFIWKA